MEFLHPEVNEAQARATEGRWQEAFAHLLSLQLFFDASDDKWLTDLTQEAIPRLRYVCMCLRVFLCVCVYVCMCVCAHQMQQGCVAARRLDFN